MFGCSAVWAFTTVILLQIVMVSPGTHRVKFMSPSPQPMSPRSSKKGVMLGPLCNQIINLEADAKTLYYRLLKLKYSAIYLKLRKD